MRSSWIFIDEISQIHGRFMHVIAISDAPVMTGDCADGTQMGDQDQRPSPAFTMHWEPPRMGDLDGFIGYGEGMVSFFSRLGLGKHDKVSVQIGQPSMNTRWLQIMFRIWYRRPGFLSQDV